MDWSIKANGMKITNSDSPTNMLARAAAESEQLKVKLQLFDKAHQSATMDVDNGKCAPADFTNRIEYYLKLWS